MPVFPDDIFAQDPLAAVIEDKTIRLKEGERRTVSILFADLKGDLHGRVAAVLVNDMKTAGYYSFIWNASSHASGIYFVKMQADKYINTQKIYLIK